MAEADVRAAGRRSPRPQGSGPLVYLPGRAARIHRGRYSSGGAVARAVLAFRVVHAATAVAKVLIEYVLVTAKRGDSGAREERERATNSPALSCSRNYHVAVRGDWLDGIICSSG